MVNLLDFGLDSRIIQLIHESVPELPGECVRIGRSGRDTHVQVLDSEISASPSTARDKKLTLQVPHHRECAASCKGMNQINSGSSYSSASCR